MTTQPQIIILSEPEFDIQMSIYEQDGIRYEYDRRYILTEWFGELEMPFLRVFDSTGNVIQLVYCNPS